MLDPIAQFSLWIQSLPGVTDAIRAVADFLNSLPH